MSDPFPFATEPVLPRDAGGPPLRVGFCVSGGGHLFRAAVEHAVSLGINATHVLLDRGAATDLETFAAAHAVSVHRLKSPRRPQLDDEMTAFFDAADADLWALTFDKLLPASVVTPRRGRIINVHMALLPAFAGMHGIRQTLTGGARFGGATLHEVDEEMDHGPLIAQCGIGTLPGDDERSAGARIWPLLRATYLQVLAWYAAGRVVRDADDCLWVCDARYGTWPIAPEPELRASIIGEL